ncbi:MAG: hypothetical protein R2707_04925 [Acidimicrobiales bacterium]
MGEVRRAAAAVVREPGLWVTALVQFRRMIPDGWWRRRPFLPVPDPAMLAFRATTQYGDPAHPLEPDDLIAWLSWCKAENRRRSVR